MSFWKTVGRIGAGVATGGLSEAARFAQNELDTGKPEREQAQQLDAEARKLWAEQRAKIPTADSMQLSYGHEGDVKPYEVGGQYIPTDQTAVDAGRTAYDGFGVDPRARSQMEGASDYFGSVMSNPVDAIAEADYARRQGQAEMQRRASADAALANLEARGQGNSGAGFTAALNSSNQEIGDEYQAGLDTNAAAQARRDSAAKDYGQAGQNLGDLTLRADQSRAQGQDAWTQWDVDNRNAINKANVAEQNTSGRDYMTRRWNVGDANSAMENETTRWNKLGAPEQEFENSQDVTAGATGQYAQSAAGMRQDGANKFNIFKDAIIPFGSNVVRAAAK